MVGAALLERPRHVLVGGLALGQRDVPARARPNRVDGAEEVGDVARLQVEHPVGGGRGGDDDGRHAGQPPQLAAGEVVGAHAVGAGGDDLGAPVVLPDVGRRPVAALVAVGAPQLGPGLGAQGREVGLLLVVDDEVDAAVVEHRRRRGAPPVAGLGRGQVARPEHRPVEAEGVEADVAEQHVEALSVGDGGLRRERVLQVVRRCRHPGVDLGPPARLAGLEVEGVDEPVVNVLRGGPLAAAVPAALGRLDLSVARDGGDEHEAAGHDGRAPAEARERSAPGDVLVGAPPLGQVGVVRDHAGRAGPAELGPLLGRSAARGQQRHGREQQRDPIPGDDASPDLEPRPRQAVTPMQHCSVQHQNHVVTFSCARRRCSGFTCARTVASAMATAPRSSENPTPGIRSGMASRGAMK